MFPKRRTEELIVRHVDDDVLIYDLKADKAHALNATVGLVYALCDGDRDTAALAGLVAARLGVSVEEATAMTQLALEQLTHRGLLVEPMVRATGQQRISRRQVLRKLAATAVAIPAIVTLTAPWPAAALSCATAGQDCSNVFCCQGLVCNSLGNGIFRCGYQGNPS